MEMKKISPIMRRRMLLDMEEKGLSDKEIREKYSIADNRTLRKHLGLAEREREAREARIKILAENQAQHLAEIRNTIEQWKDILRIPWFDCISFETSSRPAQSLELNPLFKSLKEHLPSATLWRDYSVWQEKVEGYIDGCKKLLGEIQHDAKNSPDPEIRKIASDIGARHSVQALALTKPLHDMMAKYKAKAERQFKGSWDEIMALEEKLRTSLQEILLRRDYIVYTCRLCPGQLRPLR